METVLRAALIRSHIDASCLTSVLQITASFYRKMESREEAFMSNPVLPDDLLKEAVPGNIRRAEHFVAFLKRFIEYLKTRMKVLHVIQETPPSFLAHLKEYTFIEKKPLRFCAERLTSLVRTLELSNIEEFQPLQEVETRILMKNILDEPEKLRQHIRKYDPLLYQWTIYLCVLPPVKLVLLS